MKAGSRPWESSRSGRITVASSAEASRRSSLRVSRPAGAPVATAGNNKSARADLSELRADLEVKRTKLRLKRDNHRHPAGLMPDLERTSANDDRNGLVNLVIARVVELGLGLAKNHVEQLARGVLGLGGDRFVDFSDQVGVDAQEDSLRK